MVTVVQKKKIVDKYIKGSDYMELGLLIGADIFECFMVNKLDDIDARLIKDPYNSDLLLAKKVVEEIKEAYCDLRGVKNGR